MSGRPIKRTLRGSAPSSMSVTSRLFSEAASSATAGSPYLRTLTCKDSLGARPVHAGVWPRRPVCLGAA